MFGTSTGTSGVGVYGVNTTTTGYAGLFSGNVNVQSGFSYSYNGTGGTCVAGACMVSDQRLKRDIEALPNALDKLLTLKGVRFNWKEPAEHQNQTDVETGLIAQDVEKVFPQWVGDNGHGFRTVNVDARAMAALTIESIRTLKLENDELRARTAKLEERLNALENGRDPVTGGVGFGRGTIGLVGLGLVGALVVSQRLRKASQV